MNKLKRAEWREKVWFYVQQYELYAYCTPTVFEWLLNVMYLADVAADDAAKMVFEIFREPALRRTSGMVLLRAWCPDEDDELPDIGVDRPDHDGHG